MPQQGCNIGRLSMQFISICNKRLTSSKVSKVSQLAVSHCECLQIYKTLLEGNKEVFLVLLLLKQHWLWKSLSFIILKRAILTFIFKTIYIQYSCSKTYIWWLPKKHYWYFIIFEIYPLVLFHHCHKKL